MRERNIIRLQNLLAHSHFLRTIVRTPFVRLIRNRRTLLELRLRYLTATVRTLPDFLIIGAQRSGTTSVYMNLIRHPKIAAAYQKEVHFFNRHFQKGLGWYRSFFPTQSYVKIRSCIVGEATPDYLFYPPAAERIAQSLKDVKTIVLLRNPVERAHSQYQLHVRRGEENRSFEEVVQVGLEVLSGRIDWARIDWDWFYFEGEYFLRGIYIHQLMNWFRFFPRQNVLVLDSQNYYTDPNAVLRDIVNFLALPGEKQPRYQLEKSQAGSYKEMDRKSRFALAEFYQPYNEELYEFLGWDFGWNA